MTLEPVLLVKGRPIVELHDGRASVATWVSLPHGDGVGIGYSQHAGMVIVADGTEACAKRLARVLWNDSVTGVMRHDDAGYASARARGLDLPSLGWRAGRPDPVRDDKLAITRNVSDRCRT